MPSEESRQEQAHALAVRAREALPQREGSALLPESGVDAAISLLAQAIERLTDDSPHFILDLDEYGPGQLEALRLKVTGQESPEADTLPPVASKFVISFSDIELDLEDIWPDGAPENPTPEDVIEVMREAEYACPMQVIREWLLIESLYVRAADDEEGEGEVEWDGD